MRTPEFVCESSELMVLRRLYDCGRCGPFDERYVAATGHLTAGEDQEAVIDTTPRAWAELVAA
jgi:hypothetical protein